MNRLLILGTFLLTSQLQANEADVIKVRVECRVDCNFHVTLKHDDTGWEHYANQWDVVAPDGTVLGSRVLYHPHVNEQPFTRSLSGVKVPAGIHQVTIRAQDSVHGYGGVEQQVDLPANR